jgi:hypothetical protein
LTCAYKRNRKRLDFPIENEKGAILTLTMRLRRTGYFDGARYHADSIGGKGGTRTLDPGIMSRPEGSGSRRIMVGIWLQAHLLTTDLLDGTA